MHYINDAMGEIRDWINRLINDGCLCDAYTTKANKCRSRYELFKLASDVNGSRYLCEMQFKGRGLSYDVIKFEFANFINGKCHVEHQTKFGYYSSEIFCGLRKNVIPSNSSIMTFLDCIVEVEVAPYSHLRIFADKNSKLLIKCPDTSVCRVESWGAEISAPNNVVIINKASCQQNIHSK